MDINERSYTQTFWLTFIRDMFGIHNPEDYVDFQKRADIEHEKFIDAYIPSTGTIIEQKSSGKDFEAAFVQAKNYYDWLPLCREHYGAVEEPPLEECPKGNCLLDYPHNHFRFIIVSSSLLTG